MTQYYIGCKQVQAWEQEGDNGQPGYAVKYPDGYISWSPKGVFESAYLPMGEDNDGSVITAEMVNHFIKGVQSTARMGNHAVSNIDLANGFSLIESGACADPKNYHEEKGIEVAMERAKSKVWPLLGFALCWARNGLSQ